MKNLIVNDKALTGRNVMKRFIRTVVIEQSDLFRQGLLSILSRTRFRVVAAHANLDGFLVNGTTSGNECVMLISLDTDSTAIFAGLPPLKQRHQHLRVVMLSDQSDPEHLLTAFESGVDCYLFKRNLSSDKLLKSMDLVLLGETVMPQTFFRLFREQLRLRIEMGSDLGRDVGRIQALPPPHMPEAIEVDDSFRFSAKERSILGHLTKGASNKHIAREMGTAESTIKVHMKAILRKIGVRNRTQAAMWAANNAGRLAISD